LILGREMMGSVPDRDMDGSIPGRDMTGFILDRGKTFSSPPWRPDRFWALSSLLPSGYRGMFLRVGKWSWYWNTVNMLVFQLPHKPSWSGT
jgi:hypothetical protein